MKIEYLIAFILLLFESKYFNIKIFNERSQLYRVAFEKRFNVDIKKQFQKNLRKKIKTEKYKLFFEFIKPPETAK